MSGSSYKFTFTGNKSVLESTYFPSIELVSDTNYMIGLVDLYTYNSIPNIHENCNKFYGAQEEIVIPEGSYEIDAIESYLQNILSKKKYKTKFKSKQ